MMQLLLLYASLWLAPGVCSSWVTVECSTGDDAWGAAQGRTVGECPMARSYPKCELKFELIAEVADHLSRDHGIDVQTPARADLLGSSRNL